MAGTTAVQAKLSNKAAKSAHSSATQNAVVPSFTFPNIACAAECAFTFQGTGYSGCYNACVGNTQSGSPTVVPSGGSSTNNQTVKSSGPVKTVNTGSGSGTGSGTGSSASGVPNLANINWSDIGIRAGLVIGGSILVIVGVVKIFSGQPVNVPGQLARRRPTPSPPPMMQSRSFVETRPVSSPPPNPTVRTRPNIAAAAAGEA